MDSPPPISPPGSPLADEDFEEIYNYKEYTAKASSLQFTPLLGRNVTNDIENTPNSILTEKEETKEHTLDTLRPRKFRKMEEDDSITEEQPTKVTVPKFANQRRENYIKIKLKNRKGNKKWKKGKSGGYNRSSHSSHKFDTSQF